jgi:hypothetical protein
MDVLESLMLVGKMLGSKRAHVLRKLPKKNVYMLVLGDLLDLVDLLGRADLLETIALVLL